MIIVKKIKITCFTSVFDLPTLKFLKKFNLPAYKVASFENNHLPLIAKLAKQKKPLIISTGMCNINDIKEIYKILIKENVKTLLFLNARVHIQLIQKNLIFLQLKN